MLSSLSVGKVDAYPLVEPQDIANVTSNPFPFIGLFKLGAERFFVLRQVILSFQPTDFMQIKTKQPEVGLLILF